MQKRYWLRGLITGIVTHGLFVLAVYVLGSGDWKSYITLLLAVYCSPIILFGLFLGWLYGKTKTRLIHNS
jgi:hypothetical protein